MYWHAVFNLTLTHFERAELVIFVQLFFEIWKVSNKRTKGQTADNFVTKQSFEHMRMACNSLLISQAAYRDFYPHNKYNPSLDGSDGCEGRFSTTATFNGQTRNTDAETFRGVNNAINEAIFSRHDEGVQATQYRRPNSDVLIAGQPLPRNIDGSERSTEGRSATPGRVTYTEEMLQDRYPAILDAVFDFLVPLGVTFPEGRPVIDVRGQRLPVVDDDEEDEVDEDTIEIDLPGDDLEDDDDAAGWETPPEDEALDGLDEGLDLSVEEQMVVANMAPTPDIDTELFAGRGFGTMGELLKHVTDHGDFDLGVRDGENARLRIDAVRELLKPMGLDVGYVEKTGQCASSAYVAAMLDRLVAADNGNAVTKHKAAIVTGDDGDTVLFDFSLSRMSGRSERRRHGGAKSLKAPWFGRECFAAAEKLRALAVYRITERSKIPEFREAYATASYANGSTDRALDKYIWKVKSPTFFWGPPELHETALEMEHHLVIISVNKKLQTAVLTFGVPDAPHTMKIVLVVDSVDNHYWTTFVVPQPGPALVVGDGAAAMDQPIGAAGAAAEEPIGKTTGGVAQARKACIYVPRPTKSNPKGWVAVTPSMALDLLQEVPEVLAARVQRYGSAKRQNGITFLDVMNAPRSVDSLEIRLHDDVAVHFLDTDNTTNRIFIGTVKSIVYIPGDAGKTGGCRHYGAVRNTQCKGISVTCTWYTWVGWKAGTSEKDKLQPMNVDKADQLYEKRPAAMLADMNVVKITTADMAPFIRPVTMVSLPDTPTHFRIDPADFEPLCKFITELA